MTEPLNLTDEQQRALVAFAVNVSSDAMDPVENSLCDRIITCALRNNILIERDRCEFDLSDWLKDASNDQDHD